MPDLARSVQARLVNHARGLNVDPNLVLTRYATERWLYRLSRSPQADRFVLKGGLLLVAWLGEATRPTRDADLLGFGELDEESVRRVVGEVFGTEVEPDGVAFDHSTIRVAPVRAEDAYGGQRVTFTARLGGARIRVQIDVGVGDAVVPAAEWLDFPSLLDLPRPRLRVYRPETAIAEKIHAMVLLGERNSRMRDFFDIQALAASESFAGDTLSRAVAATFERRRTDVPAAPVALSLRFAEVDGKQRQWVAFRTGNRLDSAPEELAVVVGRIAAFLGPVLEAVSRGELYGGRWPAGGPWQAETGRAQ